MDNRTPKDREALDRAVLKALTKKGQSRGEVVAKVDGTTERMVSASLLRLVAEGLAMREGPQNRPTYSRAVSK